MNVPRGDEPQLPEDAPQVRTTPLGSSGGAGRWLVLLAAVLLLLLVWKPWDLASERSGTGRGPLTPSALVSVPPSPTTSPLVAQSSPTTSPGLYSVPCLSASAWQLVSLERRADRESRTWVAVRPAMAEGPTDPAITFTRIVTDRVRGLGYCAAGEIDGRPLVSERLTTSAWLLTPTGESIPVRELRTLARPAASTAALFVPSAGPDEAIWQPGRYVLRIEDRASGIRVWLGVDIVAARQVRVR